jgi:hypothetical protein
MIFVILILLLAILLFVYISLNRKDEPIDLMKRMIGEKWEYNNTNIEKELEGKKLIFHLSIDKKSIIRGVYYRDNFYIPEGAVFRPKEWNKRNITNLLNNYSLCGYNINEIFIVSKGIKLVNYWIKESDRPIYQMYLEDRHWCDSIAKKVGI